MTHSFEITEPQTIDLNTFKTTPPDGLTKGVAREQTSALWAELEELQELLYGANQHSLLLIFQGQDAAGKDGGINKLGIGLDALGVKVVSFKVPSTLEREHDFLWRIHLAAPRLGEVAIFNRSQYEDVGVVRVNQLVPEEIWRARYEQINDFEAMLAANRTIICKFWLHISADEQRERLLAREEEPEKAWKLNPSDWEERSRWDDYMAAYSEAIGRCAAPHAPWYVIPADKKWYRDLAVAHTVVEHLRPYAEGWRASLAELGETQRAALAAYRAEHST